MLCVQFNLKVPFKSYLFHDQTRDATASKNYIGQKKAQNVVQCIECILI